MGLPVKLSDELVKVARTEAAATDRSITAQIEHWAKLGRSVEAALRHHEVLALKHADGDVAAAFPEAGARESVCEVLHRIATSTDQTALSESITRGRTVYESDGRGGLVRIEPDGTRTRGRLDGRTFVPAARGAVRPRR